MKRTALLRRRPIARAPFRRNHRPKIVTAAEREARLAFRLAIVGMRCVMCGRTHVEAFEETGGLGHDAHHAVPKRTLKQRGLDHLLWDPRNAVCLCAEPCHRRQESGHTRIPFDRLPYQAYEFAAECGCVDVLERLYA